VAKDGNRSGSEVCLILHFANGAHPTMPTDILAQGSGYTGRPTPRDRAVAGALTLAILVLVAWIIVQMGYGLSTSRTVLERLTAVELSSAGSAPKAKNEPQKAAAPTKRPEEISPPTLAVPPKAIVPVTMAPPSSFIPMSNADMASGDISKMAKGGGGSSGGNSSKAYGPGEGPSGQRLYRAEWYREPSNAELAGYMTERAADAQWADIACRTIENYHVDNCQALGESPPGSGLARALRQAAWQFLVRPPRIDGKPQVGAWVRIHFDFIRGEAK